MNENEQEQQLEGPDVLSARVYGNDVPGIQMAALDKAAELYGPSARLQIERTGTINTSLSSDGPFWAYVHVRCLNYAEISS